MAHPNKHIREAIKYAEERGFRVIKAGPRAHEWGHLHCTEANREGCRIAVYSTPRNPEAHAQRICRAVDQCPHQ